MASNYDNAAWFYDRLSRLVYGRALIEAHGFLINYLPPGSRVLIAGGGTGYVLEEITRRHPAGLTITYVEISAKMIALAQKRNCGGNQVSFIQSDIERAAPGRYDVIFTPFLFDNFTQPQLQQVFGRLHGQLQPGGLWLNADFRLTGKWWQPWLLKAMFVFFQLLGCVEVSRLPDMETPFRQAGYLATAQQGFFGGFISSAVYQRSEAAQG